MQIRTDVARFTDGSEGTNLPTCCVLCTWNCGLRVDVSAGKIVAVREDPDNPITGGYRCHKSASIARYVEHDQRVTQALRRTPEASFEPIAWDVAIREIAEKLTTIRSRHTPQAIGLVGIGGQANHLNAPYGLGFLRALGSHRWFNAYAQEKTQNALLDQWMFAASPTTVLHADTEHCRFLLVLGSNPIISNRGHNPAWTFRALSRDPERTLVVVDPRMTETAKAADVHLRVRPGTDWSMLVALLKSVLDEGLADEAFLSENTTGLEELRRALEGACIEDLCGRCGLEADVVTSLARSFASSPPAAILHDLGVEQAPFSTLNAYLIRLLAIVTGNLGRRGGNLFFEAFNPPSPRPPPDPSTGHEALVSGIRAIRALGDYGMFSPSLVPEEVLCEHPERLRALVVDGSNPLVTAADTSAWRRAVEALELLVVIDPAMTETARYADYVLPTPVAYEKWEWCGFPRAHPEVMTQVRPPVVCGPPNALAEAEIYARLVEAMDLFGAPPRPLLWLGYLGTRGWARSLSLALAMLYARRRRDERGVSNRILFWLYRSLGPSLPSPALVAIWLLCMTNARDRRRDVLRTLGRPWGRRSAFAIGNELFRRVLAHPEGIEVARLDPETNSIDHIGFEDKRVRLDVAPMIAELQRALQTPVEPDSDEQYPMVLCAGVRTRWTANTMHRDPRWRKGSGPHCPLRISPEDAARIGLASSDTALLETRNGKASAQVIVDDSLPPGFVTVPNGFGTTWPGPNGESLLDETCGVKLNELTAADDRDPFTGCPNHKHVHCRVTRV